MNCKESLTRTVIVPSSSSLLSPNISPTRGHFSLLPAKLSLSSIGLHPKTMSPIAQRDNKYQILRSDYDLAFQQLALDVQKLAQHPAQNGFETSAAHRHYLRTRNKLADYLLCRRAEALIMRSAPAASPDEREAPSIEEHAYFLWENSGRPGGNDQANWYDAEAHCS